MDRRGVHSETLYSWPAIILPMVALYAVDSVMACVFKCLSKTCRYNKWIIPAHSQNLEKKREMHRASEGNWKWENYEHKFTSLQRALLWVLLGTALVVLNMQCTEGSCLVRGLELQQKGSREKPPVPGMSWERFERSNLSHSCDSQQARSSCRRWFIWRLCIFLLASCFWSASILCNTSLPSVTVMQLKTAPPKGSKCFWTPLKLPILPLQLT